jgi:hypothetical protein
VGFTGFLMVKNPPQNFAVGRKTPKPLALLGVVGKVVYFARLAK